MTNQNPSSEGGSVRVVEPAEIGPRQPLEFHDLNADRLSVTARFVSDPERDDELVKVVEVTCQLGGYDPMTITLHRDRAHALGLALQELARQAS